MPPAVFFHAILLLSTKNIIINFIGNHFSGRNKICIKLNLKVFFIFAETMLKNTFKYLCCSGFILILTIKILLPVTAVFIGHFSKQIKTAVLINDQDKDDEKPADAKDYSKVKKGMDESFVHLYEFVPVVNAVNLLYHRQETLFKQTHFPPILTPPPDLA